MANYLITKLVNAQVKLFGAFQAAELRYTEPVTFKEILASSPSFYPGYDALRTREDRTLVAYFKNRTSRPLSTGRSNNHSGSHGDTSALTPSWTTYSDPFAISLKQGNNNLYTYDEMFQNELENSIKNMVEGHETTAITFLQANRTGVNIADLGTEGSFNGTNDVFEIKADSNTVFGDFHFQAGQFTGMVLNINKYGKGYTFYCDSLSYSKFQALAAQGATNATNLSFNYMGAKFVHSVGLTTLAIALGYSKGYWLAVPEGTIGCLPHIPKENRAGIDTKVQSYGAIMNPIDGLTYAIHNYETRVNGTGTNGYTQDELREFELSLDIAFDHAPLTTLNETSIFAFAIVDTLAS